jgi:hypothetical protein
MNKVARVLGALLLLLAVASTRAAVVRDLYSAQVPVADQSSRTLAKASREALAEVLVKVSGSTDVLRNPAIKAALAESRDHVQQYAYTRGDDSAGELAARIEFDDAYVTGLVKQAGAPLWTANRPLVLVWMVVEDAQGRYFVNWDSAPEMSAQLLAAFSRRGVPVQLPLFDLADAAALSPQNAWRLNGSSLRAASARYDVQDIMVGRLAALSTGKGTGDWSYFSGDNRIDRSVSASDAQTFMRKGVSIVAEEMAARYAVAPSLAAEGGVTMSVTGVSSYADYAGIVAWLEGLELIEHANVERIQGERIELRLSAQADPAQLTTIIELNDRLLPTPPAVPDATGASIGPQLSYQWRK